MSYLTVGLLFVLRYFFHIMEVKKLLEINDCTDCIHYNRVDYKYVFWIECGLTKTVLFEVPKTHSSL